MAYETKELSGSIFKNNRKEKDTHPDRTGSALIDGVHYWISGWVKKDKDGNPWMSLAFKRKDEVTKQEPRERPADIKPPMGNAPRQTTSHSRDDMDDEIPF